MTNYNTGVRGYMESIFNGQTPVERENPLPGQSRYFYYQPNQRSDITISDMKTADVPTADTPNPFLNNNSSQQHLNHASDVFSQQRKRNVEQDLLMSGMDMLYGMNRAVNGMTFGGLDWLGNKLGFDSQMNNYLNLKDAQSRNLAQMAGNVAEIGGGLLSGAGIGAAVYEPANMLYQGYKIGRAYDKLKQNPFAGNGGDVIAKMKNHNGEPVVLQRGEAIMGENGNVIISGRELQHQTGTARNYGLNKIIYKHGVPRGEVVKIPRYIKDNPLEITPRNQSVYSVKKIDGEMRVITTPRNGYETISSMYSKTR